MSVKTDDYDRGLSQAQGKATAFGSVITGIFQGVGQQLFRSMVGGLETVVARMGGAVQASSNLTESVNKTGVVFGSAAQSVVDWSATTTQAMGISQNAALAAAGQFGALFRQMGQLPAVAAANSEELVQLAADLSSIYNIPIADSLTKLRAGLAGESEPLRQLNIFLTENSVAQKAVQLGLASSTAAVSTAAKVEARRIIILEQGTIAQGDQARTAKELAGAQRKLSAEMEDGAAKLGGVFKPAIQAITNALADAAPQMFQYGANILDQLAAGLASGLRAILPVIQTVRQLFTYWFAPGSPPRVLPDIDKWGAAAMGQFLGGFSSVDVKGAFDGIGSAIESILRSQVSAGTADESGLVGRVFGTRNAIVAAVAEFSRAGNVSEATINKIVRSAGGAGKGIGDLVKSYFELRKATTAATRAQDELNSITERYDAILNPLRGQLDAVRAEQEKLANQQRLIAAQNTLNNFDSTDAEKRAAALDIQQISLEQQISTTEQKKKVETDASQAQLDGATKAQESAQKQVDIAQATIDNQVATNNLLGEQRQLEERLAGEREAAAQRQQQLADQLHQAQLQYQLGIANTNGKLALLRGELANTTAGSVEYYNLLGQIASLEKQSAEEAKRDADKVSDAQFQYNLELADTNGKIALYQQKLATVVQGTAEYFDILSKIHALQEQAAKGGALGAGDIGAGISLPSLADMPKLPDLGEGSKNLKEALEQAFAPVGPATESVKKLGDSLSALGATIGTLLGIDFKAWLEGNKQATDTTGWDMYGIVVAANTATVQQDADAAATAMKNSADATTLTLRTLQSDYKVIMDLIHGDWTQYWIDCAENFRLGNEAVNRNATAGQATWLTNFGIWLTNASTAFGTWLSNQATAISTIGQSFYDGGANLLDKFWEGLKSKWGDISSWFTTSLQGLRAQLPFSEPKDPSSPLRGLKQSGAALVDMFQSGMNSASLSINPLANQILATPNAAPSNTNNMGPITININTAGGDVQAIGKATRDGVLEAMRAAGMV